MKKKFLLALFSCAIFCSVVYAVSPVQPIDAGERLSIIRHYISENPDITMQTVNPNIYGDLYRRDFDFIKSAVATRENGAAFLAYLEELDIQFLAKFPPDQMTLAHYNHIAYLWACVLSKECPEPLAPGGFVELSAAYINTYEKKDPSEDVLEILKERVVGSPEKHYRERLLNEYAWNPTGWLIFSPGLFVPQVSATGIVPIPDMNEGFGFFLNGKPYSVDFLAVGTNPKLTYDYFTPEDDKNPYDAWRHDYEHLSRAVRVMPSDMCPMYPRVTNIAILRDRITGLETKQKALAELAFFMLIHESQDPVLDIKKNINSGKSKCEEKLEAGAEPTDVGFNSIVQHESYVGCAESLLLLCDGETTTEKYKNFLMYVIEGYEILQRMVDLHDV